MSEVKKISSRDNQKIKYARNVREGKIKDAVFAEGVRLAEEVLRSRRKIIDCFYVETFGASQREIELINKIKTECANIAVLEERVFASIAETNSPQGIVLIVEKPSTTKENFDFRLKQTSSENAPIIFLTEINNPSNLGAILRTSEAAGAAGVIISSKSADAFSPKATRGALGSNLRLPVWEKAGFETVLSWAKEKKMIGTAADVNAPNEYHKIDWTVPRLVIFGSEAHGLSESNRRSIEELIYIPMDNEVESLNLAVSCGIILFEARRQRTGRK